MVKKQNIFQKGKRYEIIFQNSGTLSLCAVMLALLCLVQRYVSGLHDGFFNDSAAERPARAYMERMANRKIGKLYRRRAGRTLLQLCGNGNEKHSRRTAYRGIGFRRCSYLHGNGSDRRCALRRL